MAQIKSRLDLNSATFPLLMDWAGRTVVQPSTPEAPAPLHTPQVLYCQDVLPTYQGYKSVSYKDLLAAASPANINFSDILTVSDVAQNKALIGITSDSKIYMVTAANYVWTDVTPGGWTGGDAVTMGVANGTTYLYLYKKACYAVNIVGIALTVTALTGITAANIYGISSSVNYLILWDATNVYWSSTVNPLDFVPSLITGAGTAIPTDLQGTIVVIQQLNNGYVIYTTVDIILSQYSNNTQYPWIWRAADNGGGISSKKQVAAAFDLGIHVAYTTAGLLQISMQGCEGILPEVSDFLSARIYESYNFTTDKVERQALTAKLLMHINVLASRYITISYGISGYTDVLVHDMLLKRWGKLHINHATAFEVETSTAPVPSPYNASSEIGQTYAAASPEPYNNAAAQFSTPPDPGRVFGILLVDGTIKIAFLNFESVTDNAVLLLGKYQAQRNYFLGIQEVDIETIQSSNTAGFGMRITSSIDGKTLLNPTTPMQTDSTEGLRTFKSRAEGKNHILHFLKSFNLTTVELTAILSSRM